MLDKIGKVFGKKKFKGTGHRLGSASDEQPQKAKSPSIPVASSSGGQQAKPPTFQGRPHTLGSPAGKTSHKQPRGLKSHPVDLPAQPISPLLQTKQQLPTTFGTLDGSSRPSSPAQSASAASEPLYEPLDPATARAAASEELQAAFAQLDSAPGGSTAKEVLQKLTGNIMAHPQEPKYRRIRLTNPKLQAAVVDSDGGLEFLLACGFELDLEEGPEGSDGNAFAVLPEDADLQQLKAAVSLLGGILSAAASGAASSGANDSAVANGVNGADKQAAARKAAEPCDRETKVLLPSGAGGNSVPDWVYQRTPAELKEALLAARRKQEQSEVLMTRAMREKLKVGSKPVAYKKSVVRVRLPEGLLLQGCFNAGEPVAAIFDWVTDCLADPGTSYELVLPDQRKPLVTAMGTLRQADLLPSVLLIFRSDGGPSQRLTLRPELMATIDAG